jgi:hypothetical protein
MARVVVIGPNLPNQDNGSFHVHAEGCADIKRSPDYRSREFDGDKANVTDYATEIEMVEDVYADFVDDDNPATEFLNDFYIFPCVKFEEKKESIVDTKTVTHLRKITFEIFKDGLFFDVEIFVKATDFRDALSEIFAMRNSRNIAY